MRYIKRKIGLHLFTSKIEKLLRSSGWSSNYFSKDSLHKKFIRDHFSPENPLNDHWNKIIFPEATEEFQKVLKEGKHTLESAESNLDFLRKEFDSYFEELLEISTIKTNQDRPLEYFMSHTSSMTHWEIGVIKFLSFLWRLFENLIKIVSLQIGNK